MHMRCINECDRPRDPALMVLIFKSVTQIENRTYIESTTKFKRNKAERTGNK